MAQADISQAVMSAVALLMTNLLAEGEDGCSHVSCCCEYACIPPGTIRV